MPIVQQGSINTTALQVPDLYVQIVAPQPQLNGVPTNILGVVGTANWGPVNSPAIVSGPSDCALQFGAMQPRKFDLGTAVYTASLQGASNFRAVRVTDGTDAAASGTLGTGIGVTFTGKYTGTLGNSLTVTVGTGTNSTSGTPTYKLTVNLPGQLSEVFDNIGGTGNTLYANMANAINNGLSGLRGPSQLIVATLGSGTTAPTNPSTVTLSGGTDGTTTITSSVLVGVDTTPRKGMYALRGTGASVVMLADADDTTQWTLQSAYGLSEGAYMVTTTPAGDTISGFATEVSTAGIDSYSMKPIFGDWCYINDTVNGGITRLVSPQGFIAGKLAALSPEQSSLNKQLSGIIATQKSFAKQQYSGAELQAIAAARGEVIANPSPGGGYFSARLGLNSSSNAAVNGDNYPRLTNYIAATINAGMGLYIGQVQSPTVQQSARATLDNFLQNMFQQKMIQAWKVILDATNNPQSRVSLGYMQADIKVVYLSITKYFLINLEGGQTVVIASNTPTPAFQ